MAFRAVSTLDAGDGGVAGGGRSVAGEGMVGRALALLQLVVDQHDPRFRTGTGNTSSTGRIFPKGLLEGCWEPACEGRRSAHEASRVPQGVKPPG